MNIYIEKNTLDSSKQIRKYITYAVENDKNQYENAREIFRKYEANNKIVFEGKYADLYKIKDLQNEDRYAAFIFTYNDKDTLNKALEECRQVISKIKSYDITDTKIITKEYQNN